ncbi:MAG: glucokinase [Legionella sp.]|nr:glucokinase [Legionella sp.]
MTNKSAPDYVIVADIGGTFARFGRAQLDTLALDKIAIFSCADYQHFEDALVGYQSQQQLEHISNVAIAIACPVLDDVISMTNAHWRFSTAQVKNKLNLDEFHVLNDFNAIAMSLPILSEQEKIQVGPGYAQEHKTQVVLGAGTGLGVAASFFQNDRLITISGEGGHASWGAKNEQEWFVLSYLKKKHLHVSYERLLSGQGLENLYQALAAYHQQEAAPVTAAQIIAAALTKKSEIAIITVAQFFNILGAYAGDLALIFSAFGGVYIAGGIVPRLLPLVEESDFRKHFEDKGRFYEFNVRIPTYIVTAEQPGILGAAVYLQQQLKGHISR